MDLGSAQGFQELEVFHCRGFDDARSIALAVREQRTVVLHLDQLEPQRVIDFVSGAVHALEGQSERLGETTFLFAPAGVVPSPASMTASAGP
ncbi:cell division protein SepF [Cyanobium sp. Aljojuca 7D2]|uniref:cell division protein SepF n=1 Tax=Cyanobium sp. Aljojuca 7D2 TaxID=2823698 RepID=UPI0020CFDDB0|nr:cell division protein SepF [Cyanobium sp. Aljojuca 7D2]MCP9891755.1 cell division protein SepF [Cyanobium sp. Aljojuca 7D2]